MYISNNVFVTKHIVQNKKENGNFMFLLPVKTIPKLIPTTITASESYLLLLAISNTAWRRSRFTSVAHGFHIRTSDVIMGHAGR